MSNRRVNRGLIGIINQHLTERESSREPRPNPQPSRPRVSLNTSTHVAKQPVKRRGRGFSNITKTVSLRKTSPTPRNATDRPRTTLSNNFTITRTGSGRAVTNKPRLQRTIPNTTATAPRKKFIVRKRPLNDQHDFTKPKKKLRLTTKSDTQRKKTQALRAQTQKDVDSVMKDLGESSTTAATTTAPAPTDKRQYVAVLARNFGPTAMPHQILMDFFGDADYDIVNVTMLGKQNGGATGSAELVFSTRDQAQHAIVHYSGKKYQGRPIRLSIMDFAVTDVRGADGQESQSSKQGVVASTQLEGNDERIGGDVDDDMEEDLEEGVFPNLTIHVDNDESEEEADEQVHQQTREGALTYVHPADVEHVETSFSVTMGSLR